MRMLVENETFPYNLTKTGEKLIFRAYSTDFQLNIVFVYICCGHTSLFSPLLCLSATPLALNISDFRLNSVRQGSLM